MAKIILKSMDDGQQLEAKYNPSEISLSKKVPWQTQKTVHGSIPDLEFTEAQSEELSFELMFDGYTDGVNVYEKYVSKLLNMMQPIAKTSTPPRIEVVWSGFPRFKGVIESVQVKYTMFFSNGAPARATAAISMKQAHQVRKASSSSPGAEPGVMLVDGTRSDTGAAALNMVADDGSPDYQEFRDKNANDKGEYESNTPATASKKANA